MLQQETRESLSHIPGLRPPPLLGHTLELVRDPFGLHSRSIAEHGDVYKLNALGRWNVCLAGADALEHVLTDPGRVFSSEGGWFMLENLFPGGLMLRDFDDHRAHRRVMQAAFRASAMRDYLTRMNAEIEGLLKGWQSDDVLQFYPAIKEMTLQLGAGVFMGMTDAKLAARLNEDFIAEVAASVTPIRKPLPFTAMQKGVRARAHLLETFSALIAERREKGGEDLFSQLCHARDEDGTGWTDQEIVDHFNFLMMAAHDTTTSALTTIIWALACFPDWQDTLRTEVGALDDGPIAYDALGDLPMTERVFKEALRFMPPVPFIPRVATKDFEWKGIRIPAGTPVIVSPGMVMRDAAYWSEPEKFDPDRFSSNRSEDRSHKYAWAPFGGGAHKCIGMHFAFMQVKAFLVQFLRAYSVERVGDGPTEWQEIPIPKPKDGLPVRLKSL